MTKRTLFALSIVVSLPVYAADYATGFPARGDSLGSGLAALWRDSHPDFPAADNWLTALRRPLVADEQHPFGRSGAIRNTGAGAVSAVRYAQSGISVVMGRGVAGRLDGVHATALRLDGGPRDWWLTSATLEGGAWRAFAAHERAQDGNGPGGADEGWRLGAAYRYGGAQLSAGWEHLRHDADLGDVRQQAWWIGLAQRVGDGALRLNFARSADMSGGLVAGPGGVRQLSLGYERGLSPQTAIYAFYTRLSNDPNGLFKLGGGEVDNGVSAMGRNGISLGVKYRF